MRPSVAYWRRARGVDDWGGPRGAEPPRGRAGPERSEGRAAPRGLHGSPSRPPPPLRTPTYRCGGCRGASVPPACKPAPGVSWGPVRGLEVPPFLWGGIFPAAASSGSGARGGPGPRPGRSPRRGCGVGAPHPGRGGPPRRLVGPEAAPGLLDGSGSVRGWPPIMGACGRAASCKSFPPTNFTPLEVRGSME